MGVLQVLENEIIAVMVSELLLCLWFIIIVKLIKLWYVQAAEHFGGVDILVSNAAVNPVFGPILEVSITDFRLLFSSLMNSCLTP